MTEQAIALATYLATTPPASGQTFDAYMADALTRFPNLSAAEIGQAIDRAAAQCRRDGERMIREREALKRLAAEGW